VRKRLALFVLSSILIAGLLSACAGIRPSPPNPPLKIVVGPVIFDAPVTKSKQIHSFENNPDSEQDRALLPILIDDIRLKAQHDLTEQFARHEGFSVVPFPEARRLLATMSGRWRTCRNPIFFTIVSSRLPPIRLCPGRSLT
jgi:hypothetical protein